MNRKGFTLIELLGVVVILGVLSILVVPTVSRVIQNSQNKAYQIQLSSIIDGLKNWATNNVTMLPDENGSSITLTMAQLKNGGYVDIDIKNPKTDLCFGNGLLLTITRLQNNYVYEIDESSNIETNNCTINFKEPNIVLNGVVHEMVQLGSSYVDKGFTATSVLGDNITSSVIVEINGDYNFINTNVLNSKYTVTYSVADNGIETTVIRNIKIIDNIKPELLIPETSTISLNVNNFDFMSGVSATDNDDKIVNIKYKTNLTFRIKGEYYIKYTATDSSGNTTNKTRKIFVDTTCFSFSNETGTITDYEDTCSRDVVIPDKINGIKVEHIGAVAFVNAESQLCTNNSIDYDLVSLNYINDGTYQDCHYEFNNSDNITSLKLPKHLITIGQSAFANSLLTTVTIPTSVLKLYSSAFHNNLLTSVTIKSKNTSSQFSIYGTDIWGWDVGYDDSDIIWNG